MACEVPHRASALVTMIAASIASACVPAPPVCAQPAASVELECVRARRLWSEDFESGDYARWTSGTYGADWGPESARCRENGITREEARSGSSSHRSAITCQSHTDVHRGYGGVQLEGERVLPSYTNEGLGLDAPYGAVTTFWARLQVPYEFGNGRWVSLWTVDTDCAWSEEVVTVGLDAPRRRLTPAHVSQIRFDAHAPRFPLGRWVRITIYVNAHRGELYVWQDGALVAGASFARPSTDLCQWHWGLYASGDNDSLELYEDDLSLWILEQEWPDCALEPWLERATMCG